MAHLGPGVLLAEQVSVEVGHLPMPLVGEAPHELPVAHVVELLPLLLSITALLKTLDSLEKHTQTHIHTNVCFSLWVLMGACKEVGVTTAITHNDIL